MLVMKNCFLIVLELSNGLNELTGAAFHSGVLRITRGTITE